MVQNKTLQSIVKYWNTYRLEITGVIFITGIFLAGLVIGVYVGEDHGYSRGAEEVPRPEYSIQTFSIEMNTTTYNETYHQLAGRDLRSTNWVIDLEPRDDYWMINIFVISRSEYWSRFFLRVESSESLWMINSTIELISINTLSWSGAGTYSYNFYDGATGGITCNTRAIVYFLGYGTYQGVDVILSNIISIEGMRVI